MLQLCAEKPLQIVIRIGQGLQRTIPQMQLHGGILHSHIDFAFAKRLPIVVRRKKIICLPAEHRRQLGRQTTDAPGGGILCQQVKIIPTVGAVAGHSTAVGLGKKLLQAAVQGVFLLHGLHVLI